MLRELADDGRSSAAARSCTSPAPCPQVVLADITDRDRDGELIADPDRMGRGGARRAAEDPHPRCRASRGRARSPASATARCCGSRRPATTATPSATPAASSRSSTAPSSACSASSARCPTAAAGSSPVDKKQLGRELAIPPGATGDAQDGELVAVETSAPRRPLRAADRAREGAARLAQERTRRQPDRDPRPRHSACVSAEPCSRKPKPRSPPSLAGREDWRKVPLVTIDPADAKDHDDAVHAEPDTDPNNPGGHVAARRHRRRRRTTCGQAPRSTARRCVRGNSVYFPDRVVPMLPERISNDLCSLRPNEDRAALAVRMVIGADGRKRSHTFHRVLMRSAAKLNYQQAQARDRRPARRHHRPAARPRCSSRSTPPIARSSARATSARRSTSTCPSARSCSPRTTPSTA